MRVIQRPESTTVALEILFHVIKDQKEATNVCVGVTETDIVIIQKMIDSNTFQPLLYFAIKQEGKDMSKWLKYVTKVELVLGTPIETSLNNIH